MCVSNVKLNPGKMSPESPTHPPKTQKKTKIYYFKSNRITVLFTIVVQLQSSLFAEFEEMYDRRS